MFKRFSFLSLFALSILFSSLLIAEQDIFIFLGAPGAGKGTMAEKLSKKTTLPHISTGDLLREKAKEQDEKSQKLNTFLAAGQLVPDDLIISILFQRVQSQDCQNGFILDGFPRTLSQAEKLQETFPQKDHIIVVNVSTPTSVILKRLEGRRICQLCSKSYHTDFHPPKVHDQCDDCKDKLITRSDDTAQTIKKRFEIYQAQYAPIKRFYKENYQWIDVKNDSVDECFSCLINKIEHINPELSLFSDN